MIKCPRCGGTNIAFDWVGVTSIRIVNDEVTSVTAGGVLGGHPDRAVCMDCGDEADLTKPHLYAVNDAATLIDDQLPSWLLTHLNDGLELYTAPGPRRTT